MKPMQTHIFKLAFLVLLIHPYLKRPADCSQNGWNWRWFMIWLKPAPRLFSSAQDGGAPIEGTQK